MNILVLDVGTSSMRGTVVSEQADVLCGNQIKYHPSAGENGYITEPVRDWTDAMDSLCGKAALCGQVDAVALTAQRSSVIPVDEKGDALTDAIMWQDNRNRDLCQSLSASGSRVRAVCGTEISTVYSGGKMRWFRENEPELYAKTARFTVIADFLLHRMTGAYILDYTYGSRSMLMDLREKVWSEEMLKLFRVEKEKLSVLTEPSSIVGHISAEYSRLTGLPCGIPVISCGGDQQCAAIGLGVTAPGSASINLGTGAYIIAAAKCAPCDLPESIICNAHGVPGIYILENRRPYCGAALDMILRLLGCEGHSELVEEAVRKRPEGASGVTVRPIFNGEFRKEHTSLSDLFCGDLDCADRLDFIRAFLEGLAGEVAAMITELNAVVPITEYKLSGGLTRSDAFCELLEKKTGHRLQRIDDGDATTRGARIAAMQALNA